MCCFKVTVFKSSTQFIVGDNYPGVLVNSFKFKFMFPKTMPRKYTLNWKLINFSSICVSQFFSNIKITMGFLLLNWQKDEDKTPLTISNHFQSSAKDIHSSPTTRKMSQALFAGKYGQSLPVT